MGYEEMAADGGFGRVGTEENRQMAEMLEQQDLREQYAMEEREARIANEVHMAEDECGPDKLDGTTELRPPLGITPRSVHRTLRARDITEAMIRYMVGKKTIPVEWRMELVELTDEANREAK